MLERGVTMVLLHVFACHLVLVSCGARTSEFADTGSVDVSAGARDGAPTDHTSGDAATSSWMHDAPVCPVCGNGIVECDESCDDGNNETERCPYETDCVVCGSACRLWPGLPNYCGDGHVDPEHEACEPPVWDSSLGRFTGQPCTRDCQLPPFDDDDGDGMANEQDNCPLSYNPDQSDLDKDNTGDACDPAWGSCPAGYEDKGGLEGACVFVARTSFSACPSCWEDPGTDGDGVGVGDNCPLDYNPAQSSSYGAAGDVCSHVVRCTGPCRWICEDRFGSLCR